MSFEISYIVAPLLGGIIGYITNNDIDSLIRGLKEGLIEQGQQNWVSLIWESRFLKS